MTKNRAESALDVTVIAIALAVFALSLHPAPYPGESTSWLLTLGGIDPFPPLTRPLYTMTGLLLARIPLGTLALRLTMLNGLCAVACAVLLGRVVRALRPIEPADPDSRAIRMGSGLVASLALIFSFPFAWAATRVSPEPLGLLLILAALDLLAQSERQSSPARLYAAMAVFGLAFPEHPMALWMAPLVLLAALLLAARRYGEVAAGAVFPHRIYLRRFMRSAALMVLALMSFAIPWFLYAVWYVRQPAARWLGVETYGSALRTLAVAGYDLVRGAVPPVGGLLLVLLVYAPAVYLLAAPYIRLRTWFVQPGYAMLCAVITGCAMYVWVMDAVSPRLGFSLWHVRGLPAVAVAFTIGRLTAWMQRPRRAGRFDPFGLERLRVVGMYAVQALAAAGVAICIGLNLQLLASANRQPWTEIAQAAARFGEGKCWWVIGDEESAIIAAESTALRRHLRALLLWRRENLAYRRYLAEQFADLRLRYLALVGVEPLLNEWLGRSELGGSEVAVFGGGELWRMVGRRPIPVGPLTRGADPTEPLVGIESWAAANIEFALRFQGRAERRERWWMTRQWNQRAAIIASRVANDTGVVLEEEGRLDEAARAYETALKVYAENWVALINRALLFEAQGQPLPEAWAARLERVAAQTKHQHLNAAALSSIFGELRRPDVLLKRGAIWAGMGRWQAAEQEWRRLGESAEGYLPLIAAGMVRAGREAEVEEQLRQRVQQEPSDVTAWLGLFRLALRRNDESAAQEALGAAAAAGAEEGEILRLRALLRHQRGETEAAIDVLSDRARQRPKEYETWVLLAALAHVANRQDQMEPALRHLRKNLDELPRPTRLRLAHVEWLNGNLAEARRVVEALLRVHPADPDALDLALRMDIFESRAELAQDRIRRLLAIDAGHALANHALGSLLIQANNWPAAEDALRRALVRERAAPILNDLAYVLVKRDRWDEALPLAREAVEQAPEDPHLWDTLGMAYAAGGLRDEAERAFRRALELAPEFEAARRNLEALPPRTPQGAEARATDP